MLQTAKLENEIKLLLEQIDGSKIDNQNKQALYDHQFHLFNAQVKLTLAEAVKTKLEAAGQKFENGILAASSPSLIKLNQANAKNAEEFRERWEQEMKQELEIAMSQTDTQNAGQWKQLFGNILSTLGNIAMLFFLKRPLPIGGGAKPKAPTNIPYRPTGRQRGMGLH